MASRPATHIWRTAVTTTTDAYLSMTSRPARTIAMIAGILLGVASASTALLIADTQQAQIDQRFDAQRSAYTMIQAQDPPPDGFTLHGARQIAALTTVGAAGELSIWRDSAAITTNPYTNPELVPLVAASSDALTGSGTATIAGADHTAMDSTQDLPVVWLGIDLAERLGIDGVQAQSVDVFGRNYSVAGLVRNSGGFGYLNTSIIMSPDLARTHYGPGERVRFLAQVRPGSASAVAEFALTALDPSGIHQLADVTQPDGEILRSNVADDMRTVGIGLGMFVGLVGMVAVANTLSMAVNQRSRELGLRSAIGWSRTRIAALILLESAIAGLVAALIGCALGMLGTYLWSAVQGWELIIYPLLAPALVVTGTLFSVLGGIIPAYRAASVSPLVAMRS